MNTEGVNKEIFMLYRAEKQALAVLSSIHFMQRDICYNLEGKLPMEHLGGVLSEQKEDMLNNIECLANYCGFELVRLEDEYAEEDR